MAVEKLAALRKDLPDNISDGSVLLYTFPAGEDQTLEVEIRINGESCEILRWQTVYSGSWQSDTHMELWDGK